jgi:DNA-binding response OmpR family regulator
MKDRDSKKIAGALNAGAEDVIHVPFVALEFGARMQAAIRRYRGGSSHKPIELHGFTLNRKGCQVLDRGVPIDLTPREFSLAWLFFSKPGINLSRKSIAATVWGTVGDIANHSIEQHVYMLRKKLCLTRERGAKIRAVYCNGYRLETISA